MNRAGGLAAIACALAFTACGGGGGTSADELEQRLTEPSPLEDPDPVVEADCPEDLSDADDAEVVCTTTTEGGVVSEVTVRNAGEDGLTFDSVSVDGPAGQADTGPRPDPAALARIERDIRTTHNDIATDDSRRATSVDCPDDFAEQTGASTSCMVTLGDGSVITYGVWVGAKEIQWFADPAPADILAGFVLDHANGQEGPEAETVECPGSLPLVKGTATSCVLTTTDGRTTDVEVSVTNETGDLHIDYGQLG